MSNWQQALYNQYKKQSAGDGELLPECMHLVGETDEYWVIKYKEYQEVIDIVFKDGRDMLSVELE